MRILCCILLSFIFLATDANGQIWIEDFDGSNTTAPLTTSPTCNNMPGASDFFFFGVVCVPGGGCGNEIDPFFTGSYANPSGSFLGGYDTDNEGGCGGPPNDNEFAEWTGINVSSCAPDDILYLCVDVAEGDELPGLDGWDGPSFTSFSVTLDGVGPIVLAVLEDQGTDSNPSFDLNCDGSGDGTVPLTNFFTSYCFEIPGHGTTLSTRIDIDGLNEDLEDIAIDNVAVYCTSDPNTLPGPVLLSCGNCGIDFDCDGVPVTVDCDDNNASITSLITNDADCDGVPTSEDCDDNDPTVTNTNVNDADCDGVPTSEDCDDNDPLNTNTNVNDADCDGVPTSEDCDDNDPLNTNSNVNDAD